VIGQVFAAASEMYGGEREVLKSVFLKDFNSRQEGILKFLSLCGMGGLVGEMVSCYEHERATVDFTVDTWYEIEVKRAEGLVKRVESLWDSVSGGALDFSLSVDDLKKIFVDHCNGSVRLLKTVGDMVALGFTYTSMFLKVRVEWEQFAKNYWGHERLLTDFHASGKSARSRGISVVRARLDRELDIGRSKVLKETSQWLHLLEVKLKKELEFEQVVLMNKLEEKARQKHVALSDELREKADRKRAQLLSVLREGD
jgi:hypothetical protein